MSRSKRLRPSAGARSSSLCSCPFHDHLKRTIIWLYAIGIVCGASVILNVIVLARLSAHGP